MTQAEARELAGKVRDGLPWSARQRLKAIHISPHLHQGHLTIRVFTVNLTASDPEPWIFTADEI